ncbi:MAG TPA: DsbA family protein, partial [Flavisolibacter sp.]|nr:DsbA family protein [Flavisolibacter sp.]
MKVEIWSDIVCPFCYIGKRRFEKALETFSNKEQVEVVWKSFQLDPSAKPNPGKSVIESLAEKKGVTLEQ